MKKVNLDNIPFTYYGDLLGVSNYYRIDPETAYEKLNFFYNETYNVLRDIERKNGKRYDLKVFLFSDSIFITGTLLESTLRHLSYLYSILFNENLLLRGAIVHGKLTFDPRMELRNMTKQLPQGDVLFRAVELEKRNKGARLVMEKKLAHLILPKKWYTTEGYFKERTDPAIPKDSLLRKIRTTPSWGAYEFLWPLIDIKEFNGRKVKFFFSDYIKKIKHLNRIVPEEASLNINETKKLFDNIKPELDELYDVFFTNVKKK
jgi:hypothetical protein